MPVYNDQKSFSDKENKHKSKTCREWLKDRSAPFEDFGVNMN